jgi:alkylation response protein AidB-like acyl-CoA dehydrogenase
MAWDFETDPEYQAQLDWADEFTTRAVKDGDEWVINGWKFFSSNASTSSFLIVMAVTNPEVNQ